MALDEELLDQMNQLELEEADLAAKMAWEKEVSEGIQSGVLNLNGNTIEFHRESLFEDKVSIMIPNNFTVMDSELATIKYPSERRPEPVFSNESASITMGFNHTDSKVKAEEIEIFKTFLLQNLQRMQSSISVLEDGVKTVNEKTIAFFEFLSPALDSDIYNLMFCVELEGRVLLTNFNCLEADMEQWQPIAKGILESLRLNLEEDLK